MKRKIIYFVLALCIADLVRADQTVQSVQQALQDQGFYYGNVTGDKSSETTAAVRRYQIRNGLQVTGEMDPGTLRSLNVNSNSAAPSQSTSKPAVAQSNSSRPEDNSQVGQVSPPPSSSEPNPQVEMNRPFAGPTYESTSPRMSRRLVIAEIQRQLISRGYYQGRIDGSYRRRTAFALRAFQFASGLPPTGHLDTSTLNALGLSNEDLASLQPAPRQYETWMPAMKFKHGKWKVKWKKYHGENRDELAGEDRAENGNEQGHGPDER